jgi:hypothetical protein
MEPRVSSTLILDQIKLMKDLYGAEAVAAARQSLAPALREEIDALLPGGWCSLETARVMKEAVASIVDEPLMTLQRRVVRVGIERTLHTVWRFFIRRLSDENLARRTPLLYSRSFDRGELRFMSVRDGEVQLELHGWPAIPEFDLVALATGVETVLSIAGRPEPRCFWSRRGLVVYMRALWKT